MIGYMGAGKTTLGRPVAWKLNVPFIDLDTIIEEREGKSIRQLFEELGEGIFREKERSGLQSGSFPADFVMATGGGAPCFFDNMEWMNRHGLTVYLKTDPEVIAARLEHEREERPLLRALTKEELPGFVREKIESREKFYLQAQLIFRDSGNLTAEDLLAALEKNLREGLK